MDDRADPHSNQDIGEHLSEGGRGLLVRVLQTLPFCQCGAIRLHASRLADEVLHIGLHVQFFNHCSAGHCNHQPYDDIDNGNLRAENAHKQHKAPQVHHRRGDQKRERYPKRQSRAGKTDKERDGGAWEKGRHSPKQGRYDIRPHAMKTA